MYRDPAQLMNASLPPVITFLESQCGPIPRFELKQVPWANQTWYMTIDADARGWWQVSYVDDYILSLTSRHSFNRLNYVSVHEIAHLYTMEAKRLETGISWHDLSLLGHGVPVSDTDIFYVDAAAEFAAVTWGLQQRTINPMALEALVLACVQAAQGGYVQEVSPTTFNHWLSQTQMQALERNFSKYLANGSGMAIEGYDRYLGLGVYLCSLIASKGYSSLAQLIRTPMTEQAFIQLAMS